MPPGSSAVAPVESDRSHIAMGSVKQEPLSFSVEAQPAAAAAPAAAGAPPPQRFSLDSRVPVAGRGATFRTQAGALLRKNAVYQRRNWCSNICLLCAPIVFCALLFMMQILINRLLLTGPDYECGCQCTQCCYDNDPNNCTLLEVGACEDLPQGPTRTCREFNETKCGLQYSAPQQAVWCAIPTPSIWPAAAQVPLPEERAVPWGPYDAVLPYTGADATLADRLSRALLPPPALDARALARAGAELNASAAAAAEDGEFLLPGQVLSLLGLTFGTSKAVQSLYLDPAFISTGGDSSLYALFPEGACEEMGFGGAAGVNMTVDELLAGMVKVSNTPDTAAQLNAVLDAALGGGGEGGGGGGGQGGLFTVTVNCTDMPINYTTTASQLQRQLYCGYYQSRCNGTSVTAQVSAAYDWQATTPASFQPVIYYNDTFGVPRDGGPGAFQRVAQFLNMAVHAWVQTSLGGNRTAELIGIQETPKVPTSLSLDFSSLLGPLFYTWVIQMLLPVFVMQLVYEKERRLRIMMKMHGLGDGAYWLVNYLWFLVLYIVYIIIFLVFGSAIGLKLFRLNSYAIQIILYFIFGNNMIAFSYLLSCLFSSSKTASVFAYLLVFATGLIGYLLLSTLIVSGAWYVVILEIIPSFALYRGLFELGEYAFLGSYKQSQGMTFSSLSDPNNGMIGVWIILAVEWVVFMVLAWYLEQVVSTGTGNNRHPLYFLDSCRKGKAGSRAAASHAALPVDINQAPDVAAETARAENLTDYVNNPIVIKDMRKVYPAQDGQPPKLAVRTLTLAIEKGECFGLLGPNGAGKSTSINMMTGLLPPSDGTAIIGGYDIRSDMDAVYTMMGVCPQDNLLWDTLTGREHLLFYGRLKGLSGKPLVAMVEAGLRSVNLWNNKVGEKQSSQYSGGMKRRLSVAVSFMGDPLVVYLDEPSTGLDPASRRNLWDVVKSSKRDRALVLTTHSMEEAEVLCDRLGIFVDGQLVCIGNPREITARYGGYLVFTITVPPGSEKAAMDLAQGLSPNARLTYSVGGTLKFELPGGETSLSQVFDRMESAKRDLQVLDWGVANATLEEVFINLARQVGAQAGD